MGNMKNPQAKQAWTEAELLELAAELGFSGNENGPRLNGQEPITVRQAACLAEMYGKRLEDILTV